MGEELNIPSAEVIVEESKDWDTESIESFPEKVEAITRYKKMSHLSQEEFDKVMRASVKLQDEGVKRDIIADYVKKEFDVKISGRFLQTYINRWREQEWLEEEFGNIGLQKMRSIQAIESREDWIRKCLREKVISYKVEVEDDKGKKKIKQVQKIITPQLLIQLNKDLAELEMYKGRVKGIDDRALTLNFVQSIAEKQSQKSQTDALSLIDPENTGYDNETLSELDILNKELQKYDKE